MEIIKYEHACFAVKKNDQIVVVDPGGFTSDFIAPENVVAVVITHQHPDHFDQDQINSIFAKNNEVILFGPDSVIDQIEIENKQIVKAGDRVVAGLFDLEFFGGDHAIIHASYPEVQNIGVLINDLIYYPGDSFTLPDRPIDTLALPASAPWLKISDAMDFLTQAQPRFAFPTHDAILSESGKSLVDRMLGETAKSAGIEYRRLNEVENI